MPRLFALNIAFLGCISYGEGAYLFSLRLFAAGGQESGKGQGLLFLEVEKAL
ncbi:hypothetical protein HMPREF0262_00254 [Clostridium sp. ATCC 29733]|nr:hypothetical protein HMPREF0262_00254 [Clostridium sp. ATCC 29733]